MVNTESKIFSEEYAKQAVIMQLENMFPEITSEIEKLESSGEENEIFDPNKNAEIFGHAEMTLKEYFDSKIKKIKDALNYIKGDEHEKAIQQRYLMLIAYYNKFFKPEKFILRSLEYIIGGITQIKRERLDAETVSVYRSEIARSTLDFNKYIKMMGITSFGPSFMEMIDESNINLKELSLPLIEY